jgi:peptidoglycan/xylan/chitin deacetylase (PgdA/CDA1 family)
MSVDVKFARVAREAVELPTMRDRLRQAVLSLIAQTSRIPTGGFLRCVYLHYVFDDQIEQFERLLVHMQSVGEFITTARLADIIRERAPLPHNARYFHLSFDDGFDNNFRNAAPVLRKLGIPALFFIPTNFPDATREYVVSKWKGWRYLRQPVTPMSWNEIRQLRDYGFELGSHTHNHMRLSEISDEQTLKKEIAGSKAEMERQLGMPCRYFSWPFGRAADLSQRAAEMIEAAGYELCFSAIRGRVQPGKTSPMRVPRHHFEPEWPWPHLRYFLSGKRETL